MYRLFGIHLNVISDDNEEPPADDIRADIGPPTQPSHPPPGPDKMPLPFPPVPPQRQPHSMPVEEALQAAVAAAVQGVLLTFNQGGSAPAPPMVVPSAPAPPMAVQSAPAPPVSWPSIQPRGAFTPTFARAGQASVAMAAAPAVVPRDTSSVKALSRWQARANASDEPGWISKKRQRAIDHAARKASGEQQSGPSYVDIVMCGQCNLQQPGRRCPFRCCRGCCPLDADGTHCEQHSQD